MDIQWILKFLIDHGLIVIFVLLSSYVVAAHRIFSEDLKIEERINKMDMFPDCKECGDRNNPTVTSLGVCVSCHLKRTFAGIRERNESRAAERERRRAERTSGRPTPRTEPAYLEPAAPDAVPGREGGTGPGNAATNRSKRRAVPPTGPDRQTRR